MLRNRILTVFAICVLSISFGLVPVGQAQAGDALKGAIIGAGVGGLVDGKDGAKKGAVAGGLAGAILGD